MAERKIVWTTDAEDDFDFIIEKIQTKSISKADRWGELLIEKLELLKQFPEIGRIVPEKQLSFFREIKIE